jgi:8-oxo-dGTP pyrophosphatase MutT (NUDIX family)
VFVARARLQQDHFFAEAWLREGKDKFNGLAITIPLTAIFRLLQSEREVMKGVHMSDVGRVMFGVGGLIVHPSDNARFLLLKRATAHSDFNQEKWEILYGRKAPMEEIEDALKREAEEELSITDLSLQMPIRMWHFYRGERSEEKEIIGITFVCKTGEIEPSISAEHSDYRWVTPDEALEMVTVPGIRQDIEIFKGLQANTPAFHLSPTTIELKSYPSNWLR